MKKLAYYILISISLLGLVFTWLIDPVRNPAHLQWPPIDQPLEVTTPTYQQNFEIILLYVVCGLFLILSILGLFFHSRRHHARTQASTDSS